MKFVYVLFLAALTTAIAIATPLDTYTSATEALEAGDPEAAAERYVELIESDWHSPELYHNLGVAYQRQGKTEAALLQLYRAWLLKPFSSTAKAQFLSQAKEAEISKTRLGQAEAQAAALAWRSPTALGAITLFWTGLILIILVKKPLARGFGFASVAIGVLIGGAAHYFHQAAPQANAAWVISSEATPLRASHGAGSPQLTTIPSLAQVVASNRHQDWTYVQRDQGSGGWLEEKNLGRLMPWR